MRVSSFSFSMVLLVTQVDRDPVVPAPPAVTGRVMAEADGSPIAGSEIRVYFDERAGRTTADARATSAGDGRFAIELPASVRWFDVVVLARGKSLREYTRWSRPADLDVRLWDEVSVSGRVTTRGGAAVAGATVEIATPHEEFDGRPSGTTDSNGAWRIEHVPIDAHGLRVRSENGERETAVPFQVRGSRPETRDVVLDECARVVVRVVDAEHRPIASATLYAWTPDSPLGDDLRRYRIRAGTVLRTDAAGTVVLAHVAPQDLELAATAAGYAPAETTLAQTRTSGDVDVELVLPREATAAGVVRDGAGQAIAGARVEAWWFGSDEGDQPFASARSLTVADGANAFDAAALADAQGRFRIDRLPPLPHGRVFASSGARRADAALGDLAPGDSVEGIELVLDRSVHFTGRLLGPDGSPPREARAGSRRVDPGGHFDVEASDSRPLVLELTAPGLLSRRLVFDATCPDVVDVGDVVLGRGRALSGRVLDPEGSAIEGADVRITGNEPDPVEGSFEVSQNATTGADGAFMIEGLPAELKTMAVSAPGFASADVLEFQDPTAIDVTLSPAGVTAASVITAIPFGAIAGQVVDAKSGAPVYGFTVMVRDADSNETAPWTPSAPYIRDETFHLPQVPIGKWRVIAVASGFAPTFSAELDVMDGKTCDGVVVALERGETLTIDSGALARFATVLVVPAEQEPGPMLPARGVLGADGTGTIGHLAPGRYRIEGGTAEVAIARAAIVDVVAGGANRVSVPAAAGGCLRISRFRDCTPEPAWRYSITAEDGAEVRAGFVAQGAEVQHFLPAGRYRLTSDDPYGHPRELEIVPGMALDVRL